MGCPLARSTESTHTHTHTHRRLHPADDE